MGYDVIQGNPPKGAFPSGANTVTSAIDTNTQAEWVNIGKGWGPVSASAFKANVASTVAAQASLLVLTVPVTGLYQIFLEAVQATSTNGTPPQFQIAYTEGDTGTVFATANIGTPGATTGAGQNNQVNTVLNLKAGTTLTLSSLAPTTLTANVKARVSFLG